jgi:hypothetical protein
MILSSNEMVSVDWKVKEIRRKMRITREKSQFNRPSPIVFKG